MSLLNGVVSCSNSGKSTNPAESLAEYISQNSPLITAHRGFAEIAPENTISAFEAALNAGADASEFDVHMTLDGVLVVIHDDSVDRTTNGTGLISELTYEYLSTLDAGSWKDPKFAGEKIPTLRQTLTYFKENNMVAVLEIKVADIVDEILEMLYDTKMDKRTVIISFEESAIIKILNEKPEIPALLLLYDDAYMTGSTQNKVNNISQKANEIGTKYVGPFAFQLENLDPTLVPEAIHNLQNNIDPGELPLALDAETIAALHKKGIIIDAWTVDSEENIRDLVTFNVNFLTTNYLERAIRIKKEVQSSGCFIAGAAYGVNSVEVGVLRTFRDGFLAGNMAGRLFTNTYYRVSPAFAEVISENKALSFIARAHPTPFVRAAGLLRQ